LLLPDDHTQDNVHASATVLSAVRTIIIADLVMSLDNVVAIAGAA
jgi:predicted tellurium resistance membrane protein TerC